MSDRCQEWFNTMVRGLAAQGWKQAIDAAGICAYRTSDGLRCAVGHLLDEDRANRLCGSIAELDMIADLGLCDISYFEYEFLRQAQLKHDSKDVSTMKQRFQNLGMEYRLTWPEDVPYELP